jgi:autotransporter-associated beta strand protein
MKTNPHFRLLSLMACSALATPLIARAWRHDHGNRFVKAVAPAGAKGHAGGATAAGSQSAPFDREFTDLVATARKGKSSGAGQKSYPAMLWDFLTGDDPAKASAVKHTVLDPTFGEISVEFADRLEAKRRSTWPVGGNAGSLTEIGGDFFAALDAARSGSPSSTGSDVTLCPIGINGPDIWTGASNTFSTAGNWTGTNAPPVSGDSLVFGAAGAGGFFLNNDLTSASFNVAGITFNSSAFSYIIGDGGSTGNAGNTFVLTGGVTNNSTNVQTINNAFSVTAVQTFTTTAGGGDIVLGGNLSGAGGGINVTGGGTLTLTGANTYTGNTTIASGAKLQIGNGGATGSIPTNSAIIDNGTLVFNLAGINTFGGTITGSGGLTQAGYILLLSGRQYYTGPTQVNSNSYLALAGVDNALASSTVVTIDSGGNLDIANHAQTFAGLSDGLSGGGLLYSAGGNTGSLTLNIPSGKSYTFSGVLGGTLTSPFADFSFTMSGGGTEILAGANNYTGSTTIASGSTLQIGNGGSTGSLPSGSAITNNGTLVFDLTGDNTFGGDIYGSGGLTIAGQILRLSVAQHYSGPTQVNAGGYLVLTGSSDNGLLSSTVVNVAAGGNLDLSARNQTFAGLDGGGIVYSYNSTISTLTLDVATGQTHDFSGTLGWSYPNFGLTVSGSGTQILSGTANYTGTTTISMGTLQLGDGGTTGSLPTGSTTIDNATLAFNRSNTVTQGSDFAATISGSGGITQLGSGTLVLSGTNTYTGATLVSAGRLMLSGSLGNTAVMVGPGGTLDGKGSIGAGGSLTFNSGSTLAADLTIGGALSVGGNLILNGTVNVAFDALPSSMVYGQPILLLTYGGTLTGSAANFTSGYRTSFSIPTAGQVDVTFSSPKALTWSGGSAAWDLNGAANWNAGADKFYQSDSVTFGDSGSNKAVTLNEAVSPASVTFSNSAGNNYSINGAGSISIAGSGLIQNGSGAVTIGVPISGTGSVTQSGTGTLTLAGANTYSGATTISTGTLQLGNGGTTGSLSPGSAITDNATLVFNRSNTVTQGSDFAATIGGSGQLVQQGSGTLILTGTNTYNGGTTIASGATLQIGNGGTVGSLIGDVTDNGTLTFARTDNNNYAGYTYSGVISGSGGLTQAGYILRLTAAQTYTGPTQINFGSYLVLAPTVDNGLSASTIVTIASGGFLDLANQAQTFAGLAGGGLLYSAGGSTGSLTLNVPSGQTDNFSGVLGGNGFPNFSFTKSGTGTQILSGANVYAGATNINSGTLQIGNGDTTGSLPTGSLTTDNATLAFNRSNTVTQGTDFPSVISGSGQLIQRGSGTLILTGANTYSGGTTIASGSTLQIDAGAGTGSIVGNVTNNGTLIFDRPDIYTFNGVISGSGGLTNNGYAVLLTAAQTYTGPTSIATGAILVLPSTVDHGLSPSTVVTLAPAGYIDLAGRSQIFAGLQGTTVDEGGGVASSIANTGVLTLDVASGQTYNFPGIIGASYPDFALVKSGPGTQILSGPNVYNGGTTINGGILQVGDGGSSSSSYIIGNVVDNATFVIDLNDAFYFPGIVSGTGGMEIKGGTPTIFSAQTYSGPTKIDSGAGLVLPATVPGLAATSVVTVLAGGSLDMSNQPQTFAGLAGGGTVYSTGATSSLLTLQVASGQTYNFCGSLGGSSPGFGLTKSGAGTQILSGTNTYTGTTTVSGGTLEVDGSIAASSVVSVSLGGTLGGHGSVGKISGAGLVAPGDPQILTATQVDPSGGLDFDFSLTQTGSPTYGTASASGNDMLHLTNSTPFVFALSAANTVTLDFSGASLQLGQTYLGGFFTDAAVSNSFLSGATFAYTGLNGATVQYEGLVTVPSAAFATGTVTNGKIMEFQVIAVPEPGSAGLALLGGLGLLLRLRKRTAA